ncbi:peptidoglycan-binding protein [Candidatus Solirubrobacter pratensis]|uniref:peptidoglycan-binding protein n=1 Tax=Candidatus Solirubrobacter pratensis TaxID=1298857 RepID=UPI0004241337|nr:peptidoglycan-binding protein [Candidatus Solirubrobacter pratensis]
MHRWITGSLAAVMTVAAAPAAFGAGPTPAAGWHGREIRDPLPPASLLTKRAWPRGWSAGAVKLGSGYAHGSKRVREVQRRLRARGYRTGHIDGRFGPRTRAALTWFQIKHGLALTGTADLATVAALRFRHAGTSETAVAGAPRPHTAAAGARGGSPALAIVALIALLVALAVIGAWIGAALRRRSRRQDPPAPVAPAEPRRPAEERPSSRDAEAAPAPRRWDSGGPPPPPRLVAVDRPDELDHRPNRVLGYVRSRAGEPPAARLKESAETIAAWCERRGWELGQVVHDVEAPERRRVDRPGLNYALGQVADGAAAGLVCVKLSDLADSVADLGALLQAFADGDAFLVALDYDIDTSSTEGALAISALREVGEWERRRSERHARRGLAAVSTHAAVRDDPALSARIAAMRARGMSLQAIADTLNDEGVPTIRGGSHWRPSSVQAATGYKRPPARGNGGA